MLDGESTIRIKRRGPKEAAAGVSVSKIAGAFLKVGCIGFGGGSALIPVIERELAGERGYLSEEEYLHHTVVANITPGALPVKLGATCGERLGGIAGSLAGAYTVMLPGTIITVAVMALFGLLGENVLSAFRHASVGITAFIVFLLAGYVARVLRQGGRAVNLALCCVAFAVTGGKELRELIRLASGLEAGAPLLDISTIHLMIATFFLILAHAAAKGRRWVFAAAVILDAAYVASSGKLAAGFALPWYLLPAAMLLFLLFLYRRGGRRRRVRLSQRTLLLILCFLLPPALLAALAAALANDGGILSFLGRIGLSTVTSFGGGEAYVSVADGVFVQGGLVTPEAFYTRLVPVANALPGPILVKIAAGVGYQYGAGGGSALLGWVLAAAAASVAVGVCCSVAAIVFDLYDVLRESALVSGLKQYMLPVISGMLVSTSLAMLAESAHVTGERGVPGGVCLIVSAAWVALLFAVTRKRHVNDLLLLLASAGGSLLCLTL